MRCVERSWRCVLPGLVAILAFANSLQGGFVIDDGSAIRTNQDLRPETPLSQLLVNDFWGRPIASTTSVKSYRPLTVLSFRWNFAAHGLDVFGYHAVNVLLHSLCTLLLHCLVDQLLQDQLAAEVAALSFAVHPVHCEAVASIVGRAELLCCVFYLLCLLIMQRCCRCDVSAGAAHSRSWLLLAATVGCAALATLCKETGVTALGACCALDLMNAMPPGVAASRRRVRCALRCALAAASTAAMIAASHRLRAGQLSPHFSFVDNPIPSLPTATARVLSALHVHVRYARLLLWPATLSADYSYNCVPPVETLRDPRNASAAALYAAIGWAALAAWRPLRTPPKPDDVWATTTAAAAVGGKTRARAPAAPATTMRAAQVARALVVLVVPLVPASHLLLGVGTTIAERLLYIPSAGFCMLLGIAASAASEAAATRAAAAAAAASAAAAHERRRRRSGRLSRMLLALPVAGMTAAAAARTLRRNVEWRSSAAITRATAAACPGSAKAQLSLGTAHLQHNDAAAARLAFRRALAIVPDYADALYWLGRIALTHGGRPRQAEALLLAALELNSVHAEALLFAALCASRRSDDAAALPLLARAYALAPHNAEITRDYGAVLFRLDRTALALPLLRRSAQMLAEQNAGRSALASALLKLAAALLKTNQHAECAQLAAQAATLEPVAAASAVALRDACQNAQRMGQDTSGAIIDMAL